MSNDNDKMNLPDTSNGESDSGQTVENESAGQAVDMAAQFTAMELELAEWKDKFFRKSAEFENYKRRTEQEQANLIKYGGEQITTKILPVIDDLERSLQHAGDSTDASKVFQGVKMIYDKFIKILNEQGISKFESAGKPFDVNYHDALLQHETKEVPPHTVLQEVLPGYLYKEKILRHAQVIVSTWPDEPAEKADNPAEEGKQK